MWNPKNKPRCPFCNHATKSMAHLLNRCQREFGNFYSRRHNRIADYLYEQFKTTDRRYKTYNNKHIDTIMAQHRERLVLCNNRCYHLYFNSHEMVKLKNIHRQLIFQYNWAIRKTIRCVLVHWEILRKNVVVLFKKYAEIKWFSIHNIIESNYIWRNRAKKLLLR